MLSSPERRALRAKSHPLKPVVLLGQHQVTSAVLAAIDEALTTHELIKVRLRGIEREERTATAELLATDTGSEVINLIGQVLTLYRARPEPPPAPPPRVVKKKTKPRAHAKQSASKPPRRRTPN